MSINNLPGAIWPILFGAIYAGLQVFVSAHRPVAPPAEIVRWAQPVLDAQPAARLEWVEERDYVGYAVVNPVTETVYLLEDSQRRG